MTIKTGIYELPEIMKFAYIGTPDSFNQKLAELSDLAMPESWDYINPTGGLPILKSYIFHTFKKIQEEGKIIIQGKLCAFNTGLVTEKQEEIFMLFEKNSNLSAKTDWYFKSFNKDSDMNICSFSILPQRANYFSNPSELIYDTSNRISVNYQHIIDDNIDRFPKEFIDSPMRLGLLKNAIDSAVKRVHRNYKTAIPQYYGGKIQLLLPLCLLSPDKADLALLVGKIHESGGLVYRASTCLTLRYGTQ